MSAKSNANTLDPESSPVVSCDIVRSRGDSPPDDERRLRTSQPWTSLVSVYLHLEIVFTLYIGT